MAIPRRDMLAFEDGPGAVHRLAALGRLKLPARQLERLRLAALSSPDPDRALGALVALIEGRSARGWRPLPRHRGAIQLLSALASCSEPLAHAVIAEPQLLSALASHGVLERTSQRLQSALTFRLARVPVGDLAAAQSVLRRARHRELCRLAIREIRGGWTS